MSPTQQNFVWESNKTTTVHKPLDPHPRPSTASCQRPSFKRRRLKGKCQIKSVVYKAEVTCKDKMNRPIPNKIYYGLTARKFKQRYNEHMRSFKTEPKQSTTLSTYVWKLKKRGLVPEVHWSIHKRAHAFSSGSRKCDLCLTEKMAILFADPIHALNTRDEIMSKCRHRAKFTLKKAKPHSSQIFPPLPTWRFFHLPTEIYFSVGPLLLFSLKDFPDDWTTIHETDCRNLVIYKCVKIKNIVLQ